MSMLETNNLGDIWPADMQAEKPALIMVHGPESEAVITYGALKSRSNAVARGLDRDG